MPLYSFVDFKKCKEKFVVKTAWCYGMNSAKVKNYGNRSTIEKTIFFSPDSNVEANFPLPIQSKFDVKKPNCYKGYVLKTFGEFIFHFSV